MTDASGRGQPNGRPTDHRGQPLDLGAWAQRPAIATQTVGQAHVEILLTAAWHDREFFALARRTIREAWWDAAAEIGATHIWPALCEIDDAGQRPTYEMVGLRVMERIRASASMLPDDIVAGLLNGDPNVGLIANLAATRVDPGMLADARSILERLAHERGIVMPLRRLLNYTNDGSYPTELPAFLAAIDEERDRITEAMAAASQRRTRHTLGELLDQLSRGELNEPQLVQDVIVVGKPTLFTGDKGIGKTLLCVELALSVATATTWLNHAAWPCGLPAADGSRQPVPVLLASVESGRGVLTPLLDKMLARKIELAPERSDEIYAARENLQVEDEDLPDLGDSASVRRWARECRSAGQRLLVIDPLNNAMGSIADDLKNSPKVYPKLRYAVATFRDAGVTLLLTHHNVVDRTPRQGYPLPDDRNAAFPAIRQVARQMIAISPAAEYDPATKTNTLWVRIRGSDRIAPGTWRVATTEGARDELWAASCTPQIQVIAAEKRQAAERQQMDATVRANEIASWMEGRPDAAVTRREIRERWGQSRLTTAALEALARGRRTEECEVARGNNGRLVSALRAVPPHDIGRPTVRQAGDPDTPDTPSTAAVR